MKRLFLFLYLILSLGFAFGQGRDNLPRCSVLGQTPETAFPVCGTDVFEQEEVPNCVNGKFPWEGCDDGNEYYDESPFWYEFTAFESGSLGLLIEPDNHNDDYDWAIFDVTDKDPSTVFSDLSLMISNNFSGEPGNTGTDANAQSNFVCGSTQGGPFRPLFSSMPNVVEGHKYLLMVSHFSGSQQSGYKLSFGGGTAVITDPNPPALKDVEIDCEGLRMDVTLTKPVKCESLADDGSDFEIVGGNAAIASLEKSACEDAFDIQQLVLILDQPLEEGNYSLAVKEGTDGNTLLDHCDNPASENDQLAFEKEEILPTAMEQVEDVGCAPDKIRVVFEDDIRCNSIAADGSDFQIIQTSTGNAWPIISAEAIDCDGGLTKGVTLNLGKAIVEKGAYELSLQEGSDGNTVISQCGVASDPQTLSFQGYDTVSASIVPTLTYECNQVDIVLSNPGGNGIDDWQWTLPDGAEQTNDEVHFVDTTFSNYQIVLDVDNGVCSDHQEILIEPDRDYLIRADFSTPDFICPQDDAAFVDQSVGNNITSWEWDFGNGETHNGQTPPQQDYPSVTDLTEFYTTLKVTNSKGCEDVIEKPVNVVNSCEVNVPTAFTPNQDGHNDFLYPINAYLAEDLTFSVFNRYGQKVYETQDWTKGWDGTFKGKKQPTGSYVWMLKFINSRTDKKISRKGATLLIR